ncbi:MAG: molecular chaperone DnaK (HSP70) [Chlamydiales bacterium]|jgi:molecular chaperone DnaK (HSP70)
MTKEKYIIGIDLGTTNCTLAYTKHEEAAQTQGMPAPEIHQFSIPQVTASGVQDENLTLPSFVYFPLEEELSKKNAVIAWGPERQFCVGGYARDRGSEMHGRMISSAKSWLCHDGIDRREKNLPVDGESEKMSAVEASAEYLRHLREAWDQEKVEAPFKEQSILITVPASFDPAARQLVLEAATLAEYPEVILLEEPQAAFYSWLHKNSETWRKQLSVGDHILVVDIGGGTTDFSLIAAKDKDGDLQLERVSVGSHLLLGGDNMDLAMAHMVKQKLEKEGHSIDDWQLRELVHASRKAKEVLMGGDSLESIEMTIQGRGSSLIGGAIACHITSTEVKKLLVDGFFPLVDPEEQSQSQRRSGIRGLGLPYAQDPRVSCQLAKFLSMTGEKDGQSMDSFVMPTAVLFNGGVMKAEALQERIVTLLNSWAKKLKKEAVKVLEGPDFDYSVGRGAASYGLARKGSAVRIKSGSSRNYYIGIEEAIPAIPGLAAPLKALCVVPFGMEEGTELEIEGQEFALVLGEPATFRFFSKSPDFSKGEERSVPGSIVRNWESDLEELHPIETVLDQGADEGKTVRIKLKAKVTELGVLELWCFSEQGREWKLEFDIRKEEVALQ